jgi:ADP-ribosylglycohydrolase
MNVGSVPSTNAPSAVRRGPDDELERRAVGCLVGSAVGDALGGPTEGHSPEAIRNRYGGPVSGLVGPFYADWRTRKPASPYHKGDGHVTDDTLMTHLLVRVYETRRDHLSAYDLAELFVPLILEELVWIPELHTETVPLQRIFLAEKWIVARLYHAHADPREAGVGNIVNCGAAMYMAPVGIANVGDPQGAYNEAIDISGAHQWSYGREAAGVFAAAVAAALSPGATVESVVASCLDVAHDGTRSAIECVCERASTLAAHPIDAADVLREAVAPYDSVGPDYRQPALDARRPSRLRAIEELPIALGMLVLAEGNYEDAVLGGVNYGRDADSIASMAGALAGALNGAEAVSREWSQTVAQASRLDLEGPGRVMATIARELFSADMQRADRRAAAFKQLTAGQT